MNHQPHQSFVVRAFNSFAHLWPRRAPDKPLSALTLLDQAAGAAGHSDFGDDDFFEPFERFVASLEETDNLHPFGRFYTTQVITSLLTNRLRLVSLWRAHPEILEQPIHAPLVILGLPRSGTSFLFNMLALDPKHRVLSNWEATISQVPPRGTYDFRRDPRRRLGSFAIKLQDYLAPELRRIHEFHLDGPEECTPLLMQSFDCQALAGAFDVPSYSAWLSGTTRPSVYQHHKRILQTLQWKYPNERWVLKAPDHVRGVDSLLGTYPDACLIQMHRDPAECVPSWASLNRAFRGIHSKSVNTADLGRLALSRLSTDLASSDAARRRADPRRFHDIEYRDLVRDPLDTVTGIYRRFGLPHSDAAVEHLQDYLAADRKKQRHQHYSAAAFGLSAATVRNHMRSHFSATPRPGVSL